MFKLSIINQYLISEVNSPYLYQAAGPAPEGIHQKTNHFLALQILQNTGHLEFIDSLISTQMRNQVLSLPHLLEDKVKAKSMEGLLEDELVQGVDGSNAQDKVLKLVKLIKIESNKLRELQKRRINNFDKCLQLQIDAILSQIQFGGADGLDALKLSDPVKMLIANSPSLQKQIQSGLGQFEKLTKYKSTLQELSL